ncbi:hypothetical protein EV426DRAFT_701789 [Tirmania nivea]|nr:hypothetical protein EV426DRAFT_701789 [Tirmania nivea]
MDFFLDALEVRRQENLERIERRSRETPPNKLFKVYGIRQTGRWLESSVVCLYIWAVLVARTWEDLHTPIWRKERGEEEKWDAVEAHFAYLYRPLAGR